MSAGDKLIRASTAAVVVALAAVAAYVSYRHALEVVQAHGETGTTATLLPLTIDGLVYVASMVLLDAARQQRRAPGLARWTLGLGIAATVAANVLHGITHGPVGAVIAAWPAVTLVLVFELLMMLIRGRATGPVITPTTAPALAADPALATARERFADVLSAGETPSLRALRRELRVGHPRAVRIRAGLAGEAARS